MNKAIFLLSSAGPLRRSPCEQPLWVTIEEQIERTFEAGGSIELALCEKIFEPKEQNLVLDIVHMEAVPGMFRIIVNPRRSSGEKKVTTREWWEPENTPFRGGKKFGDDEWDLRTVCTDMSVAKTLFRDFFDHKGVSETLLKSTHSIWDESAWIKPVR
jgi:hypothetical protein